MAGHLPPGPLSTGPPFSPLLQRKASSLFSPPSGSAGPPFGALCTQRGPFRKLYRFFFSFQARKDLRRPADGAARAAGVK